MRAFFENLTGPSKGTNSWLHHDVMTARVGSDRMLRLDEGDDHSHSASAVARLTWNEDTYTIEAVNNRNIWLNGRHIGSASLMHGDTVEFEDDGPISRFRLCDRFFAKHFSVEEILGDAIAYTRSSRRPLGGRLSLAAGESMRRIALQTTVLFRVSVLAVFGLIAIFGFLLFQNDKRLEQALEDEALRIELVTLLLAKTREEALHTADLDALQDELQGQLQRNTDRLGVLESHSDAAARVVRMSSESIAFVQGAYGLRESESGKLLRHVLGQDGTMLMTPFGQPRIEPDGDGDPAQFQFTGTGFLLEPGEYLVTNRHVALPWTSGDRAKSFEQAGLIPEMLKLRVYFPNIEAPLNAELVAHSDFADLAILKLLSSADGRVGLRLASTPPKAGEELFLLGFPTGLRALLAQAGPDFLQDLGAEMELDFWSVSELLSAADLIKPLASRGIVAQISPRAVVYDAETTVGGSGGPALNRSGAVVAVNAAVMPEFGGSNIGVPVNHLKELVEKVAKQ